MNKIIYALILLHFSFFLQAQEKKDWKAFWISKEHCQSLPNTWLAFRKVVDIDDIPQLLIANIAADSKYWLWINGEMVVYEGGLKRGPSPSDTYYDEIDISSFLKKGENTIAILLWHFGKNGFSHNNSGHAALLFEAVSPQFEIISDNTWECSIYKAYQNTNLPQPNYRLPESNIRFDGREEMIGWYKPDFKGKLSNADTHFSQVEAPMGKLYKRPIPFFKNYGMKDYANQRKSLNGDTIICTLPYNCHVHPYLKIKSPEGKLISISTDNSKIVSENGLRAEYITRDGDQEYENLGWLNGHEVYYVIPKDVEVLKLGYRETGYDTDFTGRFECDDVFYNKLWNESLRTLYVTMRDTYMDCPDRERAQWWGDEVNELGESFYALSPSSHKLALKGIYELINWQGHDDIIFSPVPAGNWTKELPLQMLASIGWYGFYTQYFYSGDSSFVAPVYDGIHRYLHNVWKLDKSGMPIERQGAWTWGDWGENIDMGVLTTCWYYLALKAERDFALQLGKTADAQKDFEMMQTIEKCFDMKYWTKDGYRSSGYKGETDDRAQSMAVVSGLAKPDKYEEISNILKTSMYASPYMEKYVLEALFVMNKPTQALERMKTRYQAMIDDKYSTLYELWDTRGGTINHAWSGGPLTLLSQKVCGISPIEPGFKTFKIEPQMGKLKQASATVDTNYGKIEVALCRKGKTINAEITIPNGTTAIINSSSDRKPKSLSAGKHSVRILNSGN